MAACNEFQIGHTMKKRATISDPNRLIKHNFEQLRSVVKPIPAHYCFVPKGNVYITRHCRNLTQQAGKILYVIYDPKDNGRIGLHCPSDVYERVITDEAATASTRHDTIATKDGKQRSEAREMMFKMFPRIPDKEAEVILNHGFEKRSGRVGRTSKLEDDEKIELAVRAHIRHRFTKYESLLHGDFRRKGSGSSNIRLKAREQVAPEIQRVVQEWQAELTEPALVTGPPRFALRSSDKTKRSSSETQHRSTKRLRQTLRGPPRKSQTAKAIQPLQPSAGNVVVQTKQGDKLLERSSQSRLRPLAGETFLGTHANVISTSPGQVSSGNNLMEQMASLCIIQTSNIDMRSALQQYQLNPSSLLRLSKKKRNSVLRSEEQAIKRLGLREYRRLLLNMAIINESATTRGQDNTPAAPGDQLDPPHANRGLQASMSGPDPDPPHPANAVNNSLLHNRAKAPELDNDEDWTPSKGLRSRNVTETPARSARQLTPKDREIVAAWKIRRRERRRQQKRKKRLEATSKQHRKEANVIKTN